MQPLGRYCLSAPSPKLLSQALKQYNSTTEDRKKTFEELKAKDMKSAQEIELQMRKLQKIHVILLFSLIYFSLIYFPQGLLVVDIKYGQNHR